MQCLMKILKLAGLKNGNHETNFSCSNTFVNRLGL